MTFIQKIKQFFAGKPKELAPEKGYDMWADNYDSQPDNLMLALDEEIFSYLSNELSFEGKMIIDVGCGTGRHWKKIMDRNPAQLIGYDVSEGMLNMLKQKFSTAETHQSTDNNLYATKNNSCDMLISTLTIAHIENAAEAMKEWNRVVKNGGKILITDYHPAILKKGGQRTFKHEGKTIAVKNHIHTLEQINAIAGQLQWQQLRLSERKIDDSVKPYYEKQGALNVFESYKGMPVIYGMLFTKNAT